MNYHQAQTLNPEYSNTFGLWEVTTEGDEEGRTIRNLGTHTGHIDEIALALADKSYYSLQFKRVHPTSLNLSPKKKSVNVMLPIDSGTWDMGAGKRVTVLSELFRDRPIKVSNGTSYASVLISQESVNNAR